MRVGSVWGIGYVKRKFQERKAKYEQESTADRAARRTAAATWWIAAFTIILALVSAKTLIEIHGGGIDTHDLAVAAGKQAEAAGKQFEAMKTSGAETKAQIDRLIAQQKRNADAMQGSISQAQRALDASIAASQIDQRAWVGINTFGSPIISAGVQATAGFQIQNTGRTPAKYVRVYSVLDPVAAGHNPDFDDLPTQESRGTLLPNEAVHVTLNGTRGIKTGLSQIGVNMVNSGAQVLFVHGIICYSDVFDVPHWITFCTRFIPGTGELMFCPANNEIDRNGEPNRRCSKE